MADLDLGSIPETVSTLGQALTEKIAELASSVGFHSDLEVRLHEAEMARAEAERISTDAQAEAARLRTEITQAQQAVEAARAEAVQFRAAAGPVANENASLRRVINLVGVGLAVAVLAALVGWGFAVRYHSAASDTSTALKAAQEERGEARVVADSLQNIVLPQVQAERDTLESWYLRVRGQLMATPTVPEATPTTPAPAAESESETDWDAL